MPWEKEDEKPDGIVGLIKEIKEISKKADEKEGKGVSQFASLCYYELARRLKRLTLGNIRLTPSG